MLKFKKEIKKEEKVKLTRKDKANILSCTPICGYHKNKFLLKIKNNQYPYMAVYKFSGTSIKEMNMADKMSEFSSFMVALRNFVHPIKFVMMNTKIVIEATDLLTKIYDEQDNEVIKRLLEIRIENLIKIENSEKDIAFFCFVYLEEKKWERTLDLFEFNYGFLIDRILMVEELLEYRYIEHLLTKRIIGEKEDDTTI